MNDKDKMCGLTEAAFRTAVAEPVLDGNIRVLPDGTGDVYLYFKTNTLYLESIDMCVTALDVELRTVTQWHAEPSAIATRVTVLLEERGGILSSSRSLHSRRVNEAARGAAREIVSEIRLANR